MSDAVKCQRCHEAYMYCACDDNPLNESSALPACSIAIPACELEKLEQERVHLYEYLTPLLTEQQMLGLVNTTGQIWRVANTKKWD